MLQKGNKKFTKKELITIDEVVIVSMQHQGGANTHMSR
jgi:hypothetical protein